MARWTVFVALRDSTRLVAGASYGVGMVTAPTWWEARLEASRRLRRHAWFLPPTNPRLLVVRR